MTLQKKSQTFLWFNDGLEEAIEFYKRTFGDLVVGSQERLPDGRLFTCDFMLFDQEFIAMSWDGAPKFTDAVSIMIQCADQAEIDRYWNAITTEGEEIACGWCRDKWGVTWQIVPANLRDFLGHPDESKRDKINAHFRTMKRIVIAELEALAT